MAEKLVKIRMKTLAVGPEITRVPEGIYEVPEKEAKTLIKGNYAVEYKDSSTEEGGEDNGAKNKNNNTDSTGTSNLGGSEGSSKDNK